MYPPKHTLARGDTDLRVNRAHEHIDLHVFNGSQEASEGGDTDLRVNRAHGHIDLHVFRGPQTYRKEGDTDLRVNRAHGYLDLHRNKGPITLSGIGQGRRGAKPLALPASSL